jgi:hypothetical protein
VGVDNSGVFMLCSLRSQDLTTFIRVSNRFLAQFSTHLYTFPQIVENLITNTNTFLITFLIVFYLFLTIIYVIPVPNCIGNDCNIGD